MIEWHWQDWQQESLADARATSDWQQCVYEGPYGRNLSSAGNPLPRTKHHVNRQTRWEVMAIFVYPRWPLAAILDFIEPEIAPFDPLTPKILT